MNRSRLENMIICSKLPQHIHSRQP